MSFPYPDGKSDFPDVSLADLLGLPQPSARCPRRTRACLLQSWEHPGREKVVRLACRCWNCPACAARLRMQAGLHYGACVALAAGALFHVEVQGWQWPSLRDRLRYRKASHVRIETAAGIVVIGSAPLCLGVPLSDKTKGVQLLGQALATVAYPEGLPVGRKFRPVTASKDWRPAHKQPAYRLLGWLRVEDHAAIVAVLESFGIEARAHRSAGAALWDVTYTIPLSWDDGQRARLHLALKAATVSH